MTPDPQIATPRRLTMAIGYTMFFAGLKKHALELKRRKPRHLPLAAAASSTAASAPSTSRRASQQLAARSRSTG